MVHSLYIETFRYNDRVIDNIDIGLNMSLVKFGFRACMCDDLMLDSFFLKSRL